MDDAVVRFDDEDHFYQEWIGLKKKFLEYGFEMNRDKTKIMC